ncbi:hypothetical protein FGO68_gene13722 [Halteria grandinella]|uniref:Uncharacterized protein n=1 Tax=Halteria grandinella TaxID=5974 RepID=A0A8J8NTJ1_HALGN|nr:hypothetical protein FGO68_gene13722 [Halteria grandinella]
MIECSNPQASQCLSKQSGAKGRSPIITLKHFQTLIATDTLFILSPIYYFQVLQGHQYHFKKLISRQLVKFMFRLHHEVYQYASNGMRAHCFELHFQKIILNRCSLLFQLKQLYIKFQFVQRWQPIDQTSRELLSRAVSEHGCVAPLRIENSILISYYIAFCSSKQLCLSRKHISQYYHFLP